MCVAQRHGFRAIFQGPAAPASPGLQDITTRYRAPVNANACGVSACPLRHDLDPGNTKVEDYTAVRQSIAARCEVTGWAAGEATRPTLRVARCIDGPAAPSGVARGIIAIGAVRPDWVGCGDGR